MFNLKVQTQSRNKEQTRGQKIISNIFRGVTIVMMPLSCFLPSVSTYNFQTFKLFIISNNCFFGFRVSVYIGLLLVFMVYLKMYFYCHLKCANFSEYLKHLTIMTNLINVLLIRLNLN